MPRFLVELHRWLLPVIVSVALVLFVAVMAKFRNADARGRFNRIDLGMPKERVVTMFGKPHSETMSGSVHEWYFEHCTIYVSYDLEQRVYCKVMMTNRNVPVGQPKNPEEPWPTP